MTVGVIVFENNLGEKQYQPALDEEAKFWRISDGSVSWLGKRREGHVGYNALVFKSKKRALRIARRELRRRQRARSNNYYRTGEEK